MCYNKRVNSLLILSMIATEEQSRADETHHSAEIRDWINIASDPVICDQRGITMTHDGLT